MEQADLKAALARAQRGEITEHHIYQGLARRTADAHNRQVLERMAADELRHYQDLLAESGQAVAPSWPRVWFFLILGRVLGLSFALRLMERGEQAAQGLYGDAAKVWSKAGLIAQDEARHEEEILGLLEEERMRYAGSVVLGLNDALVELTGAIAGYTLALQSTRLVLLTALVTGAAATLSMAASEYLSTKAEPESGKDPIKAAAYTGAAYTLAVAVLVAPFALVSSPWAALTLTLAGALLIILVFTFYLAVARGTAFWKAYLEMAGISLGVAGVSFLLGLALRSLVGVEI